MLLFFLSQLKNKCMSDIYVAIYFIRMCKIPITDIDTWDNPKHLDIPAALIVTQKMYFISLYLVYIIYIPDYHILRKYLEYITSVCNIQIAIRPQGPLRIAEKTEFFSWQ